MRDLLGRELSAGDCLLGAALHGNLNLDLKPGPVARAQWVSVQRAELLMIDSDGAIWRCAEGSRHELVKWCRERVIRIYASPGALVDALHRGYVMGLLPGIAPRVGVPWKSSTVHSLGSASVTA